ncbi:13318_t:CDS:2 [Dentiscutata heterogama]|uniref:13318_t:CDS:1 n=1 Tax=Dentiscutata heterogama TaxID=1316150 RepID=A0ACA9MI82_9GLOM|nr:13318_t:CDS:2 [Dentiscutata heterogama]
MINELIENLGKEFSDLLEGSEDFDMKIIVGEEPNIKEFRTHSSILSEKSEYFKAALSSRWAKRENGIIIFNKPNISPSVFEILIENEISLLDVYIAADEILLDEIKLKIEKYMLENAWAWIFPKDFIRICEYNIFTNLYQISLKHVCKNPKIIFESADFLKIDEDNLINLLKRDDLLLEEIDIWEYLIKWGINNSDSILNYNLTKWTKADFIELKKALHNCIPHIRFFHLSINELRLVISKYKNILPDNLLNEIYNHLSDPKPKYYNLQRREAVYYFNSTIIKDKDAALIASWIDEKKGLPYRFKDIPFKIKLIYRASSNDFRIDKFHKICGGKGQTLVIIKVRNSNEIIGGYNPIGWYEEDIIKNQKDIDLFDDTYDEYDGYKFKETSKSFIFSLSNGTIPELSRVFSKKNAIAMCMNKGPCFGFRDLWIEYSSRRSVVGISNQHSYEIKIIDKNFFEIEEYEVFQIRRLSVLTGFAMSKFKKISKNIINNEDNKVLEVRGLGMGSCIGCGRIKSCAGCGELERCGTLKHCAICGAIKRCKTCACIVCKYKFKQNAGLGKGRCANCDKLRISKAFNCTTCGALKHCICACIVCK